MSTKRNYILWVSLLVAAVMMSCTETPFYPAPGNNDNNIASIPIQQVDTNGIEISVDEAIAICKKLASGQETGELYKLKGVITSVTTKAEDIPYKYTNINFYISDNGGKSSLQCYYTNYLNNRPFFKSSEIPAAGTQVVVQGPLTNYNGTPELKNGFIVRIVEPESPNQNQN
jgi:hypothetical protein